MTIKRRLKQALGALALFVASHETAHASECFQFAAAPAPKIMQASFTLEEGETGLRFIGHSTYLVESPEGLRIATDWSGDFSFRMDALPDVITMNHAHGTHWTPAPDPEIEHVLEGWGDGETPARHFLRLGETLIRNVPTDIRGGEYGDEAFGNSIFVFEVGGLCIGHLGHIHHMPTEDQFALLGRLDVVMVPVDGTFTLSINELIPLLERIRAQVVLPMHSFGAWSLRRFAEGMRETFEVEYLEGPDLVLSPDTLPAQPTVFIPKGV